MKSTSRNGAILRRRAMLFYLFASLLFLLVSAIMNNNRKTTSSETGVSQDACNPRLKQLKCMNEQFRGDWSGVDFSNADLRGSVFWEGSIFYGANFSNADLSGADFRSSRQRNAPMYDDFDPSYEVCRNGVCPPPVDLRSANFSNADLDDVYFGGALVSGTNFNGAWMDKASFQPISNNSPLDMRGSSFRDAHMNDASFYYADLTGVDFTNAILNRAYFVQTDLTSTKFVKSTLYKASFINSLIQGTDFKDSEASQMKLPAGCTKVDGPTTCS